MKRETKKPLDEQRRIIAYLDGLQAKVNALWRRMSESTQQVDELFESLLGESD